MAKDVQRFFERVVAAFANMVLHHAEGPGHMFREMARVVKPGGVISIVEEIKHPFAWMRDEHADM
jgi:ubiquinone/menaquinone biosynthesis C-methylase UbiE